MTVFSIIHWHWDAADSQSYLREATRTSIFYIINTMYADDLARSQGISSHVIDPVLLEHSGVITKEGHK